MIGNRWLTRDSMKTILSRCWSWHGSNTGDPTTRDYDTTWLNIHGVVTEFTHDSESTPEIFILYERCGNKMECSSTGRWSWPCSDYASRRTLPPLQGHWLVPTVPRPTHSWLLTQQTRAPSLMGEGAVAAWRALVGYLRYFIPVHEPMRLPCLLHPPESGPEHVSAASSYEGQCWR